MSSRTLLPRTRLAAVASALLLSATLTACSDAELEVAGVKVGSPEGDAGATSTPSGAPTGSATPGPSVAADDPDVEATATVVGAFQLRLPAGWSVMEGMDGAASGSSGAATYTAVPAAGKDQATWTADLLAGTTDVVAEREGLGEEPAVTLADGTQVFHLVHNYSENRAHIFGVVQGDTLHLLRFGLDGTPETAAVAVKSVSTATLVAPAASLPTMTPSATPTVPPTDTPATDPTATPPA